MPGRYLLPAAFSQPCHHFCCAQVTVSIYLHIGEPHVPPVPTAAVPHFFWGHRPSPDLPKGLVSSAAALLWQRDHSYGHGLRWEVHKWTQRPVWFF